MNLSAIHLLPQHRLVTDRFVAASQEDARIVAAFLGGSYARGTADAYSDLDLYLITTDAAYNAMRDGLDHFIHRLGEPLFLTDFDLPAARFFILANGTEGELHLGRASDFQHIHSGPYTILVDKEDLLNGVSFSQYTADPIDQELLLRDLIMDFWHEVSHFSTAIGRKQLWFAAGQIESMRRICVNLTRLRHDFTNPYAGDEPYFKIEDDLPVEGLAPLQKTFVPLEYDALLEAGKVLLRFYKDAVTTLAQERGIPYPAALEQLIIGRF